MMLNFLRMANHFMHLEEVQFY